MRRFQILYIIEKFELTKNIFQTFGSKDLGRHISIIY